MTPIAVVEVAAESAQGSGAKAYAVGGASAVPVPVIADDPLLRAAGLEWPSVARAKVARAPGLDPAASLLERAAEALSAALDDRMPGWRRRRVGVAVGTSSGGMVPLTDALARRARGEAVPANVARAAPYFGPLDALRRALRLEVDLEVQTLAACASSAFALGLGCRWLELERADVVLAGGYDAVSAFVAAGFESLGATSKRRPAPFRVGRDGMALGEAAVLFALVRAVDAPSTVFGFLSGFGASSDGVHVTAPDRTGAGLARAARGALGDAGLGAADVDLVSAHGTATPFNDAAEARALAAVLGDRATAVVVHPFKAVVGHTLGASAALELAAAFDAMNAGVLPAAAGQGEMDPDAAVRLLVRNLPGEAAHCLKLSAAFGGSNAALVGSRRATAGAPLPVSGVAIAAVGDAQAALESGDAPGLRISSEQLSRMDPLSAMCVRAAASALARAPGLPLERTGVVVGTAAATLENDEAFDRRFRQRGARGAEPRRFPPTSPNLPPGQCSIALGVLGPCLSVGSGPAAPLEALLVAHDFLAAGDMDAAIVVAAEDVGDVVAELWKAAGLPVPSRGAAAAVLRRAPSAALERARIVELWGRVRQQLGRLGAAEPGFPCFLAGVRELTAAS
jgi:3-oxoacyl-[acyl-carrier-protein] synthase-1/3-oxoacyl-[acyl-carrier-protein] synthase II